jgi:hypothetical protein
MIACRILAETIGCYDGMCSLSMFLPLHWPYGGPSRQLDTMDGSTSCSLVSLTLSVRNKADVFDSVHHTNGCNTTRVVDGISRIFTSSATLAASQSIYNKLFCMFYY